jgi:excisionase family DNA binding protein
MAHLAILHLKGLLLSKGNSNNSNLLCFPQLVGAAVVAELTGWTKKHIYDLAKRGQIPHYRIGGSIRFDLVKVKAWLDQHEIAA